MAVRIQKNHFWLWLKADSRMWTVAASERESSEPCLIPAENCLSAFSYLSSKKSCLRLLCTCCQAITHVCLCRFNSLLDCLFHSFWSSLFRTENRISPYLISINKLQNVRFSFDEYSTHFYSLKWHLSRLLLSQLLSLQRTHFYF